MKSSTGKGFWSYADETSFHGFSYAVRGWSKWEIFGWLFAVLVCLAICIQQTVTLVKIYAAEPTMTEVSIYFNKSLTIPNPVLCFQIEDPNVKDPDATIWDVEISNAGSIDSLFLNLFSMDADSLHMANDNTKNLIRLMYMTVAEIVSLEINFLYGMSAPIIWSNSAVEQTHNVMLSSNTSLADWAMLAGKLICQLMRVSAEFTYVDRFKTFQTTNYSIDVCQLDHITHLGPQIVCMNLLDTNKTLSYSGPTDALNISFYRTGWNSTAPTTTFSLDMNSHIFYNVFSDVGNVYSARIGTQNYVSLQILNTFARMSLKRRPCSPTINPFDCERICGGKIIEKLCGCWPLCFRDIKPTNSSLCTTREVLSNNISVVADYNSCATNARTTTGTLVLPADCINSCLTSCSYQQFIFATQSSEKVQPNEPTQLVLTVSDFAYTQVNEIASKDWQSFMNEFGGSIGVWLGGSILACAHVPVYILKLVYLRLTRKQKNVVTQTSKMNLYY